MNWASFFGIVGVLSALIEMGCYDLNEGDWFACTALPLAAEKGHEEVVKIFLMQKVLKITGDHAAQKYLSFVPAPIVLVICTSFLCQYYQ